MSSQQSFTITTTLPVASSGAQPESTAGFQQEAASTTNPSVTTAAIHEQQTEEPRHENGYYEKDPYVFDPRIPPAPNCEPHPGGFWYCPNTTSANGTLSSTGAAPIPSANNAGSAKAPLSPALEALAVGAVVFQFMRSNK